MVTAFGVAAVLVVVCPGAVSGVVALSDVLVCAVVHVLKAAAALLPVFFGFAGAATVVAFCVFVCLVVLFVSEFLPSARPRTQSQSLKYSA